MTAALWVPTLTSGTALVHGSLRIVDEVADLAVIFQPMVNVVTLRRTWHPELIEEIGRALDESCFRKLAAVTPGRSGLEVVREVLAGLPHLADDVHFWAGVLAELTGAERIGVRIARVDSAMCPRFHVDRVILRVVCTYEGPGTEYVSSEHVDRRRLGHAAEGAADEASGLLLSSAWIRAADPGDVVLLKGEAWPENAGWGAVHRSPQASALAARLVMTLDPL